jgi:hypothetical protein
MITCDLRGGLGNQIFQIFTTISYAIKNNISFSFLAFEYLGGGSTTIRNTYWNNFFLKLKPFLITSLENKNLKNVREEGFLYKDLIIPQNSNVMLMGYFQSYKYFEKYYPIICKMIGLENTKSFVLNKLKLNNDYFNNTISMHFRLGDYKKFPESHPIMPYQYYQKSLSFIQSIELDKQFTVIYFCEKEDIETVQNTIQLLKKEFPNYTFIHSLDISSQPLCDWEEMIIMSCCYHNIIANSSFSWWSAYFNTNMDKIVCYPFNNWFHVNLNLNISDLCPPDWIKVDAFTG